MMKPDADTAATVPDAPPAAGPDRALGAPLLDPPLPAEALAAAEGAADDEPDLATPTETPITPHVSAAAAAIHRRLLFASDRRTLDRRASLAVGAETAPPGGEDGRGDGVALVLPAAGGSEVALDTGRSERDSYRSVGRKSVILALLLLDYSGIYAEGTQPSCEDPWRRLG